jgi:hypothetical protein
MSNRFIRKEYRWADTKAMKKKWTYQIDSLEKEYKWADSLTQKQ